MFDCGHAMSSTWFDWSTRTRFCRICGHGKDEDGTRRDISPDLLAVRRLCIDSNEARGIWKVIDEQRELLECLIAHSPETLRRCPWILDWLDRTDRFLSNLIQHLDLPVTPPGQVRFPRPWPDAGLED